MRQEIGGDTELTEQGRQVWKLYVSIIIFDTIVAYLLWHYICIRKSFVFENMVNVGYWRSKSCLLAWKRETGKLQTLLCMWSLISFACFFVFVFFLSKILHISDVATAQFFFSFFLTFQPYSHLFSPQHLFFSTKSQLTSFLIICPLSSQINRCSRLIH